MSKLTGFFVKNGYKATCNHYRKLVYPLFLILLVLLLTSPVQAKYGGGTGEPNDPYLIATPNDLNSIGLDPNDWDKHFKMIADINLAEYTGTQFNMIGIWNSMWDPNNKPFSGVFDGDGHGIVNFSYAGSTTDNFGLFRAVGMCGEIRNVVMADPNVQVPTANNVGPLVGFVWECAEVLNCHVEAGSVRGANVVGGLVGANYGKLAQCGTTCSVTGVEQVGGLAGYNKYAEYYMCEHIILNCYSGGSVSGVNDVGGLVGWNGRAIIDSYARGGVSGDDTVGGLVGDNAGWVGNCYSSGAAIGTNSVGGLIGASSGPVFSSFWDVEASGEPNSSGGTGLTTAQMQDPNTFITAGWDLVDANDGFGDIWAEPNQSGYPILWWQQSPMPPIPGFPTASGQPDDPYLITTAEALNRIAYNPRLMKAHLKLTTNLDLADVNFSGIGNSLYPFEGSFNGNRCTIANLTYKPGGFGIALFNVVDSFEAEIRDLGLVDVDINMPTASAVGALVGHLDRGTVSGCWVAGGSISADRYVGGLVGYSYGMLTSCNTYVTVLGNKEAGGLVGRNIGSVFNSHATGNVIASGDYHGGLVGWNYSGRIAGCYATGDVSGAEYGGGLVGRNYYGTISDSYALGSVAGTEDIGGFVGNNDWSGSVISRCYSAGTATGTKDVGALVGSNNLGVIVDCFWDADTSGRANMCGSCDGGTGCDDLNGKTTAEMQEENTFADVGWDFTTPIWKICDEMNYPKLAWQILVGDFVCPDGVNFIDFSILASSWLSAAGEIDWNPVCDISDPNDNVINELDLAVFCENWLTGVTP